MPQPNGQRLAEDYAGMLPKKGWPHRNYRFFRYRLVPQIFRKLHGDLMTTGYWERLQEALRQGRVPRLRIYPEARKLAAEPVAAAE